MGLILLTLFIGLPIAEVYTFATVGDKIGGLATVGLCVLTAVVGIAIVRMQGFIALTRAQQTLNQGAMPVVEVFTGVCLLIAGVLLAVPGFVTDTMGFLLLLPPVRLALLALVARQVREGRMQFRGTFAGGPGGPPGAGPRGGGPRGGGHGPRSGPVDIEGEYREVDPEPAEPTPTDRRIDPPHS